jgi:competence ComEA-like helix-hairpin-helix protein
MGLQDRDYMRRRTRSSPDLDDEAELSYSSGRDWRVGFFAAACVIAIASLAIWLLRDAQFSISSSAPREGSLVVNINDATQAELETVPGIGPSIAARIITGRPYESVDDLLRVSGIGDRSLESMRPFVKTDGETQRR